MSVSTHFKHYMILDFQTASLYPFTSFLHTQNWFITWGLSDSSIQSSAVTFSEHFLWLVSVVLTVFEIMALKVFRFHLFFLLNCLYVCKCIQLFYICHNTLLQAPGSCSPLIHWRETKTASLVKHCEFMILKHILRNVIFPYRQIR